MSGGFAIIPASPRVVRRILRANPGARRTIKTLNDAKRWGRHKDFTRISKKFGKERGATLLKALRRSVFAKATRGRK